MASAADELDNLGGERPGACVGGEGDNVVGEDMAVRAKPVTGVLTLIGKPTVAESGTCVSEDGRRLPSFIRKYATKVATIQSSFSRPSDCISRKPRRPRDEMPSLAGRKQASAVGGVVSLTRIGLDAKDIHL